VQAGPAHAVAENGESTALVVGQVKRPVIELGPERPVLFE
jgi:hypothetical protein